MKKVRYIALILVLALGLIGGAYAAWTDTLTIAGSVETGELEHSWQYYDYEISPCEGGEGAYHYAEYGPYSPKELTINLHDMYPGAVVTLNPNIDNKGTVPSEISGVAVTIGGSGTLYNNIEASYVVLKIEGGNTEKVYVPEGEEWVSLSKLEAHMKEKLGGTFKLDPLGQLSFEELKFRVNPDAGNDTQNKNVSFKIKFDWEQAV